MDSLDDIPVHKLRRLMRMQEIPRRSVLKTKIEMLQAIRKHVPLSTLDTLMNAAGPCFFLKSLLPAEIVSQIARIIREDHKWWNALSKHDLDVFMRCIFFHKWTMTKPSMLAILQKAIPRTCDAKRIYKQIKQIQSQRGPPLRLTVHSSYALRHIRHKFLKRHVQAQGVHFLLGMPHEVLYNDIKLLKPAFISGTCDRKSLIDMYLCLNFTADERSCLWNKLSLCD